MERSIGTDQADRSNNRDNRSASPPADSIGENNGDWHARSASDVLGAMASSPEGLSLQEARLRLQRFGPNQLAESKPQSAWVRLLLQFHNPLIYVLLGTAVITALLAHWVDTGVIVAVVVGNAIIGFVQESKAENAIASLKRMLAPMTAVMRDGHKSNVPATALVLGDVVLLQSGDKVPADLRLLQAKNLHVDEASLTGESVSQGKQTDSLEAQVPLADRTNLAYAGTLVTKGTARGVVVATGDATEIGKIAGMLHEVKGVQTPIIRRLAYFSKVITVVILVFCILVFALGILLGNPIFTMLMAAVALAVSAIPEGLPAIMTISLAVGVKRMAGRHAVIRKLPAVEALGSTTVICTDKTGTLTRNEMTVVEVRTADSLYTVEGVGYEPVGAIRDERGNEIELANTPWLEEMLRGGVLCSEASLERENGQWIIQGDPTEGALHVLARKAGLDIDQLRQGKPRQDAIPFESDQQFMATLHADGDDSTVVYLKGSPEKMFSLCRSDAATGEPLDHDKWHATAQEMAGRGLRVLALASKRPAPEQATIEESDVEDGAQLLGLVGMMDPPRAEAISSVKRCHDAGIRVKMITGDHEETARAVAQQLDIGDHRVVTGTELERFDNEQYQKVVGEVDVFARVSPAQKLRFVQALQQQGEIVAMTGDGVNDAPALKQADIGAAMGISGTDVSKEAAEMVILDDNFASIENAVEEGRTVYNNLKKTILFILPTNGGECLTLVAALFLGAVLPILPLHILWINLITTVSLAITLAFDPVEPDAMTRPPRDPAEPLIDRVLIWRIVYVSVLMAAGTFGLFHFELAQGHSLALARSVAVNVIVFCEVFYLFNSRHLNRAVLNREGFLGNSIALWGVAAVIVLQLSFTYLPFMNALFEVEPLDIGMWLRVVACGAALLLIVEGEKAVRRRWATAPNAGPKALDGGSVNP